MEYIVIWGSVIVAIIICTIIVTRRKEKSISELVIETDAIVKSENSIVIPENNEWIIEIEMLPKETIIDKSKLVEITDSKLLARVNSLVPGLLQAGNSVGNAMQASQLVNGEVLYRAIIPSGAKLTSSKGMEGAVRGFYRGADGIQGHANLMAVEAQKGTAIIANTLSAAMGVASMVVGQYYMSQINAELCAISDGISQVKDFQDNEYQSRVFSLVTHVKKIADFQSEILENKELRLSKISQLDSLEEDCTQLLGQANLALAELITDTDINYRKYENSLGNVQKWLIYQKALLNVLYKISDLRYTLHLGNVSREFCSTLLPIYSKQASDTQVRLKEWHDEIAKHLGIEMNKSRRKREGVDGVIHCILGYLNDDWNYREIEQKIINVIIEQKYVYKNIYHNNTTELYEEDVHIIAKDGKIYYLSDWEQ